MLHETILDTTKPWFFGNNISKKLKLHPPKWNQPFFLTENKKYAEDYSDYGVYKLTLNKTAKINICEFNNTTDVKKLKWPQFLIDKINLGKSDLNSIAYDLYKLANNENADLMYIQNTANWKLIANQFKNKSKNIMDLAAKNSVWGSEKDHQILLQMWKDINDAGFDGFMHIEFGNKVLALFNIECINTISVQPIK